MTGGRSAWCGRSTTRSRRSPRRWRARPPRRRCATCSPSVTRRRSPSPPRRAAAACAARASRSTAGCSWICCGLAGIVDVDAVSLVADVRAGTFGDVLEDELRAAHHVTVGHWPQSVALSTVGGWLACRGAGQYSTRYGKIEDIVEGLDVVLADGTVVHTGGVPRAAAGPDLTQLFVGSEGTLGVITGARLRVHPTPPAERRAAYGFSSFADGLDACRRDPPARRDAGGAAPLRRRRGGPQPSHRRRASTRWSSSTRAIRARRRDDGRGRRGVRRGRPARTTTSWPGGSSTATTSRPSRR